MELGPQDLVLMKSKDGSITSAGFPLAPTRADGDGPALLLKGGGRRSGFKLEGLAVPAGLSSTRRSAAARTPTTDGGVAPDGLVEKLLALAHPPQGRPPQTKSRRRKHKPRQRTTRRSN